MVITRPLEVTMNSQRCLVIASVSGALACYPVWHDGYGHVEQIVTVPDGRYVGLARTYSAAHLFLIWFGSMPCWVGEPSGWTEPRTAGIIAGWLIGE